ncbi:MAG: LytTR family DNA-binding domain-containing protein [Bacteroidales bacterium]|nr:LytTR family DNA-binding domain-containing protein [Bacteroidales bacterium]
MMPPITSPKLTAIIVDDELHGRENLNKIIGTYCPEVEVLGLAESAVQAKLLVYSLKPDVIFLDINMPVLDGFDFLEEFDDRNFMVVFVSAFMEYGISAVKAGAADYLLKPISIKELKLTIKKLLAIHSKSQKTEIQYDNDKLVIPASHGFNVLAVDEIVRLEGDGCYTTVVMKDQKKTVVSRTLKDFEDSLPGEKFFRIHKSHLINLRYVKDYSNLSGNFVTMADESRIEISRRKAPDFIQKIKTSMKTV